MYEDDEEDEEKEEQESSSGADNCHEEHWTSVITGDSDIVNTTGGFSVFLVSFLVFFL